MSNRFIGPILIGDIGQRKLFTLILESSSFHFRPQAGLRGEPTYWPAGRVVGGGT